MKNNDNYSNLIDLVEISCFSIISFIIISLFVGIIITIPIMFIKFILNLI